MSTIPIVTNGVTTIDGPTFGVPVANQLNQKHEHVAYVPGANIDATNLGVQTLWLTLGNLTVPAWAASAIISVCINGVLLATASGACPYDLQARIGTDVGRTIRHDSTSAITTREVSWNDKITLTSTGAKSLTIYAARISGADLLRVGVISDVTVNATYLG